MGESPSVIVDDDADSDIESPDLWTPPDIGLASFTAFRIAGFLLGVAILTFVYYPQSAFDWFLISPLWASSDGASPAVPAGACS